MFRLGFVPRLGSFRTMGVLLVIAALTAPPSDWPVVTRAGDEISSQVLDTW